MVPEIGASFWPHQKVHSDVKKDVEVEIVIKMARNNKRQKTFKTAATLVFFIFKYSVLVLCKCSKYKSLAVICIENFC